MSTKSIDIEPVSSASSASSEAVERERFGLGTLVAVFAVAAVLAGSLGAGIGASLAKRPDAASLTAAGSGSTGTTPSNPGTAPAGGAGTTTTVAADHNHNADEQAEHLPDVALDPATQKLLGEQLVAARAAAARYPTVKDAKAAGLVLAGGMAPGIGAHYQKLSIDTLKGVNSDGTVNPDLPGSFIYGGTADDAPLVGLMYMSLTSETAPEGFAGANDHWHRHSNLCVVYANGEIQVPFSVDGDVTKEQCDGVKGRFMQKTIWMVHAWVVPGWESPKGVFSHDNPDVHCPDGTDVVDDKGLFCKTQ